MDARVLAQQIRAAAVAPPHLIAEALERLQAKLDRLQITSTTVEETTEELADQSMAVLDITLVGATTEITSPRIPADGEQLVARLTQDATGGRLITWHADYHASTPVDISTLSNSISVFQFCGIGGKWMMTAYRTDL